MADVRNDGMVRVTFIREGVSEEGYRTVVIREYRENGHGQPVPNNAKAGQEGDYQMRLAIHLPQNKRSFALYTSWFTSYYGSSPEGYMSHTVVILYFAHQPTRLSYGEIGVHFSAAMAVLQGCIDISLFPSMCKTQYSQASIDPALQRWCGHARLIHLGILDKDLLVLRAEH